MPFDFDETAGQNGDTSALTITTLATGHGGAEAFVVTSTRGKDEN